MEGTIDVFTLNTTASKPVRFPSSEMGQKNKGTLIKPSINPTLSTCNRHRSPVLTPDKGCRNPYAYRNIMGRFP